MIIKNNTNKSRFLYYKVGGKVQRVYIAAHGQTPDMEEITNEDQIQFNLHDRRLRYIETHWGKSFDETFTTPSEQSEYPGYYLTAVAGTGGTITPTYIKVSDSEDKLFTIIKGIKSFSLSATTNTFGSVSPSGMTISATAPYYLSAFTDSQHTTSQLTAVTGSVSGTSYYNIHNVHSAHTLNAYFGITPTGKTYTMTTSPLSRAVTSSSNSLGYVSPNGSTTVTIGTYLSAATFDGTSVIGSVSGNLSGISYYSTTVVGGSALIANFGENPTAYTYSFVASATSYNLSAQTGANGYVTPSGMSNSITAGRYLSAATVDGTSVIGSITGNLSGISSYNMTGIVDNSALVGNFGITPTGQTYSFVASAATYTLSATTNEWGYVSPSGMSISETSTYYLSALTRNSADVIGSVTGNLSGTSTYDMTGIAENNLLVGAFGIVPTGQTFTFVASAATYNLSAITNDWGYVSPSGLTNTITGGRYLSAATLDGSSVIGSVAGNLSGISTYDLTGIINNREVIGNFGATPTGQTFTFVASAATFNLSASTNDYGYVSPSGMTTTITVGRTLSALTLNGASVLGSVAGNLSGTSTCEVTGITISSELDGYFGVISTGQTFTFVASAASHTFSAFTVNAGWLSPSGSSVNVTSTYYLSAATLNGADVLGSVTGNISGTSYYGMTDIIASNELTGAFGLVLTALTFTLSAETGNYLSALTRNATSVLGSVTGDVSGTCYYESTGIWDANNSIIAIFGANGG